MHDNISQEGNFQFSACCALLSCNHLLHLAWKCLFILINVLGMWQVDIVDRYSLLISIISYLAPGVAKEIFYYVKDILCNLS